MFKVNSKDIKTTSATSFLVSLLLTINISHHCLVVVIVHFEKVNFCVYIYIYIYIPRTYIVVHNILTTLKKVFRFHIESCPAMAVHTL